MSGWFENWNKSKTRYDQKLIPHFVLIVFVCHHFSGIPILYSAHD